jgi:hypothetical protein
VREGAVKVWMGCRAANTAWWPLRPAERIVRVVTMQGWRDAWLRGGHFGGH